MSKAESDFDRKVRTWCQSILAYYRENGFWPYGGVARNMVPQNDGRNAFMNDAHGRGYIDRPGYSPGVKKRYRVVLTEKGIGSANG